MDDSSLERLLRWLEAALEENAWLILVGHQVGDRARYCTNPAAFEALVRHLHDSEAIWTAPVETIGRFLASKRQRSPTAA
jgi:hypothetical protein